MENTNRIPSPNSPAELERIVEEIYQAKPWAGGSYFKALAILRHWTLTFLVSVYVIFTAIFPFFLEIIFFLYALIFDLTMQKIKHFGEKDYKLLIKEILQQHFEESDLKISLPKLIIGILMFFILLFILIKTRDGISLFTFPITSLGIEQSPYRIQWMFFLFSLSLLIFSAFIILENSKKSFRGRVIDNYNTTFDKTGQTKFSMYVLIDSNSIYGSWRLGYFYSIVAIIFSLFGILSSFNNFGKGFIYLYIIFMSLLINRSFEIKRISQFSAQYYYDNYIKTNGDKK